jgi:hypothetical protein
MVMKGAIIDLAIPHGLFRMAETFKSNSPMIGDLSLTKADQPAYLRNAERNARGSE